MRMLLSPHPARRAHGPLTLGLVLITVFLSALACNLPTVRPTDSESVPDSHPYQVVQAIQEEAGVSLEEALATASEDRRPQIMELMGPPDTFRLEWQEIEGQVIRWEEWSYYDYQARFDFVDGELLWTVDLEPAPDGTVYAHIFDPLEFEVYMSPANVRALLPELAFEELSLVDVDIPEGMFLAADQILLGFDDERLVYVQTFMLAPVQGTP